MRSFKIEDVSPVMEQEPAFQHGLGPVTVNAELQSPDHSEGTLNPAIDLPVADEEISDHSNDEEQTELSPAQAGRLALQTIDRRITQPIAREQYANVPKDTFDLYFQQMGGTKLLRAHEEIALAQQIEDGEAAAELLADENEYSEQDVAELALRQQNGQRASEMFVRANLRLALNRAAKRNHPGNNLELSDLTQFGNIGILRAVEKYDWRRGYRFSTYATWWVKQSIHRGMAKTENDIRLPVAFYEHRNKVYSATRRLRDEIDDREPTDAEVAKAAGLTEDKVEDVRMHTYAMRSLNKPVGSDADAANLEDFIADELEDTEEKAVDTVVIGEYREAIQAAMHRVLEVREIVIVSKRFGLEGEDGATLEEVGAELKISRERVRQLEIDALVKLRSVMDPAAFEGL